MGRTTKMPLSLSWVDWEDRKLPIFFDEDVKIMDAPVDFIRAYSLTPTKQLDYKTINKWVYFLKAFFEWCIENKKSWGKITDNVLEEFKESYTNQIVAKSQRGTTELSAKKTTNHCLRTLYTFYAWSQAEGYVNKKTIGKGIGVKIKSDLPYKDDPNKNTKKSDYYPLIYTGIGENSRTNPTGYFMTPDDISDVSDYLSENGGKHTSSRNLLALAIADEMAFRTESICSLTIDLFDEDKINTSESDHIKITPSKQKFGYLKPFKMPYKLALRIIRYIKNDRALLMKENDWTDANAKDALFINMNNGSPITSQSLSDIFTDASQAIGLPAGAGIHAIRRKVGQDVSDAAVNSAIELGETPRQEDVEFMAMQKLGHADISSQTRYRKSLSKSRSDTESWGHYERLKEAEREVLELKSELAALKKTHN